MRVQRTVHDEERRSGYQRDPPPDLSTTRRGTPEPAEACAGDALLDRARQRDQESHARHEQRAREDEADLATKTNDTGSDDRLETRDH